ncbi:MAG TPA: hemolysin family protein [Bacillota bacterium]|nr:hemolysin family protein [Bacillota bacterium]
MLDFFNLMLIAILILTTAFFVAAEFSIVRVRPTRIQQLATTGEKKSLAALKVISNLDGYLSACQLGITITALALGWIGEPTIQHLLLPLFAWLNVPPNISLLVSLLLAFSLITFLHVVMGELAPKTVAIHKAEWVSIWTAQPIILFYKVMFPFIWLLNGASRRVTAILGLKPASELEITHTEEEIRSILNESYTSGQINKEELHYMNNIFQFDDRLAKEIMVPRLEISVFDTDSTMEENMETIMKEKYTRFPIALRGDKDQIIGIVHTKELFHAMLDHKIESIQPFIRPALTVSETIPIRDLLKKMQKQETQMSVLIDEYGGTAGLVTVEDILEEIVGEIRDEFDFEEEPLVTKVDNNHYIVDGKVLVTDINRLLQSHLDDTEVDTIGGWVYTHAPELKEGTEFMDEEVLITILNMDHHRVKRIEIEKSNP